MLASFSEPFGIQSHGVLYQPLSRPQSLSLTHKRTHSLIPTRLFSSFLHSVLDIFDTFFISFYFHLTLSLLQPFIDLLIFRSSFFPRFHSFIYFPSHYHSCSLSLSFLLSLISVSHSLSHFFLVDSVCLYQSFSFSLSFPLVLSLFLSFSQFLFLSHSLHLCHFLSFFLTHSMPLLSFSLTVASSCVKNIKTWISRPEKQRRRRNDGRHHDNQNTLKNEKRIFSFKFFSLFCGNRKILKNDFFQEEPKIFSTYIVFLTSF